MDQNMQIGLIKAIKKKYTTIISENGFICMVEILITAIKLKAKIIEVPLTLNTSDRKGKSKMDMLASSISYIRLLMKRNF